MTPRPSVSGNCRQEQWAKGQNDNFILTLPYKDRISIGSFNPAASSGVVSNTGAPMCYSGIELGMDQIMIPQPRALSLDRQSLCLPRNITALSPSTRSARRIQAANNPEVPGMLSKRGFKTMSKLAYGFNSIDPIAVTPNDGKHPPGLTYAVVAF